jgi:hypothetical protein
MAGRCTTVPVGVGSDGERIVMISANPKKPIRTAATPYSAILPG